MNKGPSNKLINLGLFFSLLLFSSILSAQTPSVVVLSTDTSICESGVVTLRVKFSGNAPFGIAYETYENGSYVKTNTQLNGDIYNEYWETSFVADTNTTIKVVRVYDDTTEKPWKYPENGVEVTGQEMNITDYSRTSPDAGETISAMCGYEATLDATPENPDHPHYWSESPDGTFTDRNDPKTTFKAYDEGNFTLWFVEENGACKDSAAVKVELLGSPSATLSGAKHICSTSGMSAHITLTVNYQSSHAPYSYTVSDGTSSYTRENLTITPNSINVPATGDQTFTITSLSDTRSGKQCFGAPEDMKGTAVVTDLKPAAYAGKDTISCGNLSVTLDASLENPLNTGLWSSGSGNISFSNPTSPTSTATAPTYLIDTLVWTEREPELGCKNSGEVIVNWAEKPGLKYSKDTAICSGGTATLVMNASGNSPWILTYHVDASAGNDLVLNSPTETKEFSPAQSSVITFDSIKGNYGCVSVLDKNYNITVDEMPSANPGTYDPVCSDKIQLDARPSITNSSGTWQGNGIFEDANDPATLFTSDSYGEQTLTWTEVNKNNAYCTSSAEVTIRFDETPSDAYAGEDKNLYMQFSVTLDADPVTVGTGTWTASLPEITFEDVNAPNTLAKNLKLGSQILTWTVSNGVCENKSDDVIIEVNGLVNPTGFSPNGDGVNDFFVIVGADQIHGNHLKVFDRKGKLVYSKDNYKNDWDGTGLDGSPLDDGTYYYIFTGENIDPIKEYLIIKRSMTE